MIKLSKNKNRFSRKKLVGIWGLYEEICNNNRLFFEKDEPVDKSKIMPTPENELFKRYREDNIEVRSIDTIDDLEKVDLFIFYDYPRNENPLVKKAFNMNAPKFLVVLEGKMIWPLNWHPVYLQHFEKVFTYHDDVIDNEKFFKLSYAFYIPENFSIDNSNRTKFCTTIIGNKGHDHPHSLYQERINSIRWFEQHHPDKFEFFGKGWDQEDFPSYRGTVKSKFDCFNQYKFSICYENMTGVNGYITEKVVDSMMAGSVPVYIGAPNITEFIPESCFIDLRKFNNYWELYDYLDNMPQAEYLNYQNSIAEFFNSDASNPLSLETYVKTIYDETIKTLSEKTESATGIKPASNNSSPLVSICIPTYNRAGHLEVAIKSALLQTYSNIEIIISDNASTDETEEVCREFEKNHKEVKYFRHKNNMAGLINMRRCVHNLAQGEYVLILSDDDFLVDQDFIQKAVGRLNEFPENQISMIFSEYLVIDPENDSVVNASSFNLPRIMNGEEFFQYFWRPYYIPLLTCVFNRKKAISANAWNECEIPAEDTILWLKLCLEGDVCFVNEFSAAYRWGAQGSSGTHDLITSLNTFCKNIYLFILPYRDAVAKGKKIETLRQWKINMMGYFLSQSIPNEDVKSFYIESGVLDKLADLYRKAIDENYSYELELELEEKIIKDFHQGVASYVEQIAGDPEERSIDLQRQINGSFQVQNSALRYYYLRANYFIGEQNYSRALEYLNLCIEEIESGRSESSLSLDKLLLLKEKMKSLE